MNRVRASCRAVVARAAILAVAVAGAPAAASAQATEWNGYTLEDLEGIYLRTEADATCEAVGVSAATVQSEAEATLFEAVTLLTEQEMLEAAGHPELRITLQCSEGEDGAASGALAYSVSVRVQQAAQMIRDPQITLAEAVTWWSTAVGSVDASDAEEALKSAINAKLTEFAEAFAAANADEGGPG